MRDPIIKITKSKRAGIVPQLVECLPSKCNIQSSNNSTIKETTSAESLSITLDQIECKASWQKEKVDVLKHSDEYKGTNERVFM
jgi:hypothetical protein